jgi:hypothetical protein
MLKRLEVANQQLIPLHSQARERISAAESLPKLLSDVFRKDDVRVVADLIASGDCVLD